MEEEPNAGSKLRNCYQYQESYASRVLQVVVRMQGKPSCILHKSLRLKRIFDKLHHDPDFFVCSSVFHS